MINSIPHKYAKRIDSLSYSGGRYFVGLKAGWFINAPGHHKFTEDDMKEVIATLHLHTFVCECPRCEKKLIGVNT